MKGRRGNREGSIYQDRDGRWRAVVYLGYGRRKYLSGGTRQEVAHKLSEALAAQARGQLVTSPQQPLQAFLEQWLRDSVQPRVRPWTYKGYEVLVRVHITPVLGRVTLQKLTPQHVEALMNQKLREGLSPKTVHYVRGVLRTALNQALKWGLVGRNVASLVDGPRIERKPIAPLAPEEARTLLTAAETDRLGALYVLALSLGLRQGEALGLRWEDVDLDTATVRINHQLQRLDGGWQLVPPKTSLSRRSLDLPPSVVTSLRRQRQQQLEERLLAGERWQEHGLVFTTRTGTPLDGPNVTKRFQRFLADAGLPRRRFHDLRHSCATLLLVQNVPPRVVMEILGHSQISLTMNTYSHVLPSLKRDAARQMEAILTAGRPDRQV